MNTYFRDDELNYAPFIEAVLRNPVGDKSIRIELVIDTGFQGGVLIPLPTYMDLGLNLFEEPKIIAQTAIGSEIELRVSKAIIEINGLNILCSAYTTLGVRRALLGREVLKKTGLLYRPPDELRIGFTSST